MLLYTACFVRSVTRLEIDKVVKSFTLPSGRAGEPGKMIYRIRFRPLQVHPNDVRLPLNMPEVTREEFGGSGYISRNRGPDFIPLRVMIIL
jgi:hypothetical protein